MMKRQKLTGVAGSGATRDHVQEWTRQALCCAALCLAAATVYAQQATITPNYKDADLRQIIEAVSEITGKNFIIDPRVKAQVTVLSSTPMTPEAFYETFLSTLQVYGFVAVESGNVVKILPDANARQMPGAETSRNNSRPDDILTQVIQVQSVAAAQLVPILRPLIPQYGHLAAYPASNMLIISDRSANVQRLMNIIRRIDKAGDEEIEIIGLEHASAGEIVRIITTLNQGARADGGAPSTTVVADERTNSVLVSDDRSDRLRLRALITHLDTPLEDGGNTRVRYLRYADAEELATKLQTQYTQQASAQQGGAATSEITIWADKQTNAMVVTAPPKIMRGMMTVIDKLDIRRAQVQVEAIIVEVSADKSSELGVTWAAGDQDFENAIATTNFPDRTNGVVQLGSAIGSDGTLDPTSLINSGVTLGIGRISDTGVSFAAIISALAGDANTNIMGRPTILMMDNEEAEIKVGQEVPFVTGNFTNSGTNQGTVNPFQTIQREEVGLSLKITPQINEGDAVMLQIEQEVSSISESSQAVDLITNTRTISTSVIVEDGGILVLGGLLQDELRESEQRVPLLGSLPLLGALFRAKSTAMVQTNLMVFIRPVILRYNAQATFETNAKYNYMRDLQMGGSDDVDLMPNESRPVLPPIEELQRSKPVIDMRLPQDSADDGN
jgi:general secretion pathway protein D